MKKIKLILMTAVIVFSAVLYCSVNALALTNGDIQNPNNEQGNTDTHNCPTKIFADLDVTAWYHPHTDYVLENDIMKGAAMGEQAVFMPSENHTRAFLATTLYTIEGAEIAEDRSDIVPPFEDVYADYHLKAIVWAYQNGIMNGITKTSFAPNNDITREQFVTVMHRYAMFKGYDVESGENTNILSYSDFESVSEYATSSMQWAVGSGLIKGKTESTLNPLDNVTRVEAAAIFHRFIELYK